MVIIYI